MKVFNTFNQTDQKIRRDDSIIADAIFKFLNQGNLYAINEIVENFRSEDEKYGVVRAFLQKYNFDFRKHI